MPAVTTLEEALADGAGDTFFRQKGQKSGEGWVRRLYGTLSKFSHSRPGRTSGDIWKSNGPIYVPEGFNKTALLFIEAFAVMLLLVKLGHRSFVLPEVCDARVFRSPRVVPPTVALQARAALFGQGEA